MSSVSAVSLQIRPDMEAEIILGAGEMGGDDPFGGASFEGAPPPPIAADNQPLDMGVFSEVSASHACATDACGY